MLVSDFGRPRLSLEHETMGTGTNRYAFLAPDSFFGRIFSLFLNALRVKLHTFVSCGFLDASMILVEEEKG
jgi:hypothetical protein